MHSLFVFREIKTEGIISTYSKIQSLIMNMILILGHVMGLILYLDYRRLLRVIHTGQEHVSDMHVSCSRWQEQELISFWPGHFILDEKLKRRTPVKSL